MVKKKQSMYQRLMETWSFPLLKGIIDLGLVYVFFLLAIDSGSYWHYLLVIVFLVMGLKFLTRSFKNHGKK